MALEYSESWGIKVNKSHAAAYATVSYITAWLKYHYPAEYMTSVLAKTNDFKELPKLVKQCKKMNLTLFPPNINKSQNAFLNRENNILFGFGNIKGIGNAGKAIVTEREAHGVFLSMKDYILRMIQGGYSEGCKKNVVENLIKAGAFDEFCDGNRTSLLNGFQELISITKAMLEKQTKVEERQTALEETKLTENESQIKEAERNLLSAQKTYQKKKEFFDTYSFVYTSEDIFQKLKDERDLLCFYFSGNPLNEYTDALSATKNRIEIVDASEQKKGSKVTVCGIVENIQLLHRKIDGRPFAFFTLVDETSEITVKCFVNQYEKLNDYIKEDNVLMLKGIIQTEYKSSETNVDENEEIEEEIYYIKMDSADYLQRNANERIIISGDTLCDWLTNYEKICQYKSLTGYSAFWCDNVDLELRKISFPISKDILLTDFPGLSMTLAKN